MSAYRWSAQRSACGLLVAAAAAALLLPMMMATYVHAATNAKDAVVAAGWTVKGDAEGSAQVPLAVAVTHAVTAANLEAECAALSEPKSSRYGQYYDAARMAEFIVEPTTVAAVKAWLLAAGADHVSVVATGDWVRTTLTVQQVEAAFGVDMVVWEHEASGHMVVRASVEQDEPSVVSLPQSLAGAADLVLGIWDMPVPKQRTHTRPATAVSTPATSVVPAAPVINSVFLNETSVVVAFVQTCAVAAPANAYNPPCSHDADPIDHFVMRAAINGGGAVDYVVPLSQTFSQAFQGNTHCYCGIFPTTPLPEFAMVNVSVAAVSRSGAMSAFGVVPWQPSVPYEYRELQTSPFVTPQILWDFYGLGDPRGAAVHPNVTQAVVNFNGQYYSPSDLATFISKFDLGNTPAVTLNGPNNPQVPGDEASLDIQWITAMAPSVPTTFWSIAVQNNSDSYILSWAMLVSDTLNPPLVTSISYDGGEDLVNIMKRFGPGYMQRCNAEFVKMCMRGLTLVVSSGDGGATNLGHGAPSDNCALEPQFPATSPWVTAVSATFMTNHTQPRSGSTVGEQPVSIPNGMQWTTGGGFSTIETARWYQTDAVNEYLSTAASDLPPVGMWNKTGRAYPDISAIGHNLMVQLGIRLIPIDGTSASSPIFAGIVSRLNNARLTAGKAPVGFLNPALYGLYAQDPSAFYDLVGGNNACGASACCPYGFPVTKGYDAVTGLGTIGDYQKLEAYMLSLP